MVSSPPGRISGRSCAPFRIPLKLFDLFTRPRRVAAIVLAIYSSRSSLQHPDFVSFPSSFATRIARVLSGLPDPNRRDAFIYATLAFPSHTFRFSRLPILGF